MNHHSVAASIYYMWHVQPTVLQCFASLRKIRRSVSSATLQVLVVALVHSRLYYGNVVLVGLPAQLMCRLQSVLTAAARLIYRLRTRDHITDALISLHWLRAPDEFSTCWLFWHTDFYMATHHATLVR